MIHRLRLIENLQSIFFIIFFVLNFLNREFANIFLILLIFVTLADYKRLYFALKYNQQLVICIILFSSWVSLVAYYHQTPLHELDNYFRFLLLLPLILISIKEKTFIIVIYLCAASAALNSVYSYTFLEFERYKGSSSSIITYSYMCTTMMLIGIYYIVLKRVRTTLMFISVFIFLLLILLSSTRGALITLIIGYLYITGLVIMRNKSISISRTLITLLFAFVLMIVLIPNQMQERLSVLYKSDLSNMTNFSVIDGSINNRSIRERAFYIKYGLDSLENNAHLGLGPQNVEGDMLQYIYKTETKLITARDHLHNDFLDISVKFGIYSLILLFSIYYFLFKSKKQEGQEIINLVLITLISSQLMQSQFAHHQAISFFIILCYLFTNERDTDKKYF